MDTQQFLDWVVAPGNYLAVCFKSPDRGIGTRFFRRDDVQAAATFIAWASSKGMETWYAVASYATAIPHPKNPSQLTGERTQANVEALRAFWVDLDLKRPGDKKQAGSVFADAAAAMTWLGGFLATTQMPRPNLWVCSGYGIHIYWTLETPMTRAEWQPYADALRAALIATHCTTDTGISADSARILRPAATRNFKVATSPMPVYTMDTRTLGRYPNALILDALKPYVGVIPAKANTTVVNGGALAGPAPAMAARVNGAAIVAAQNGVQQRPWSFAAIARRCEQVKQSLANGGLGDDRRVWYLGHLSLAHFCADGADFVHPISSGDPRYTAAETDAMVAQIADEKANKGGGAPTCAHYNAAKPGVCTGCPFFGKINSPITLGLDDGDLPPGYRRHNGLIQQARDTKEGISWSDVFAGDVFAPTLDLDAAQPTLVCTYERNDKQRPIAVKFGEMPVDKARANAYFGARGFTYGDIERGPHITRFFMAWMDELRRQKQERDEELTPFGWAIKDRVHRGFAVGGVLYRPDGTSEPAPGADLLMLRRYTARGSLDTWKEVAEFVLKDRVDLQVLVAASFGAPLMTFTGENGGVLSAWSTDSAVGKSSAFKVGQTVWGSLDAMCSLDDTHNSIRHRLGSGKVMPSYWDEVPLDDENARSTLNLFFGITQGKDRERLTPDVALREAGTWRTIMVVSGNREVTEFVRHQRKGTDAGVVRLFEYRITREKLPYVSGAGPLIEQLNENFGKAGIEYARWLAANRDKTRAAIDATMDMIAKTWGNDEHREERFYAAICSCIIVGAMAARKLGLVDFDIAGIQDLLKRNIKRMRSERETMLVSGGRLDLVQLLDMFTRKYTEQTADHDYFPRPGPANLRNTMHQAPSRGPVVVHISRRDEEMRLSRIEFEAFCRHSGFSSNEVFRLMEATWCASRARLSIGGGTAFPTRQGSMISVPLKHPDLRAYLGAEPKGEPT